MKNQKITVTVFLDGVPYIEDICETFEEAQELFFKYNTAYGRVNKAFIMICVDRVPQATQFPELYIVHAN